jgi:hypothetical protein
MSKAPHEERVIAEKTDLDARLVALLSFIDTVTFHKLPEAEQKRLRLQRLAMSLYSEVLSQRIDAFPAVPRETMAARPLPVIPLPTPARYHAPKSAEAPEPGRSWYEHA